MTLLVELTASAMSAASGVMEPWNSAGTRRVVMVVGYIENWN